MSKALKKMYGWCLHAYRTVFSYPKYIINASADYSYDQYWRERRSGAPRPITPWQKDRANLVLKAIAGGKNLTIGDIGSGEGTILKYIKDQSSAVSKVIGYDSSPLAREWACSIGVETLPLNLHHPQWAGTIQECDYFLLMEIIEHVPNSEEVVAATFAKSRRGVFITIPNTGFLLHRLRLLFGSFPMQWKAMPDEHLRFWTLRDMRWWLRALQFKRASVRGYRGVPVLNGLWPGLFAAGLFIEIRK